MRPRNPSTSNIAQQLETAKKMEKALECLVALPRPKKETLLDEMMQKTVQDCASTLAKLKEYLNQQSPTIKEPYQQAAEDDTLQIKPRF